MPTVELGVGPIEYADNGGEGPVLVLTHGFPMSGTQWRKVLPHLTGYRCVLPTLPLGGHRLPMHPHADLGQAAQARLLAEFLERLGLTDITLIMNDWGGPQFLVTQGLDARVARLVFVSCEAFDNFPPRPARPILALLKIRPGAWLAVQLMRTHLFRHHKRAFGGMSRVGIPDDVLDEWFAPARSDPAIRRGMVKFAKGTPGRATLLAWSDALARFDRPALVVWGAEDSMMPVAHARRLARMLPAADLEIIDGAATLVPEDRPEEFARVLLSFLERTGARPRSR